MNGEELEFVFHDGGQCVVAVGEEVRLHRNGLPDDALGREPAIVDLGSDSFDGDALENFRGRRRGL